FPARAAERALHATPPERRSPLARDVFSLFHYPIVLGIVLFAVAAKKTLAAPADPLSDAGRWALGLGVATYLAGFVLGLYRSSRRVAWERGAGAAAALVAVLLLDRLDAVALLAVVVGVLTVAVALEAARLRDVRARLRA
ncbi:MAG TPA: low temperature requirement protein A, partial [Chloroflexota bacterium]